jgi:hypothetical protein
MYCTGVFQTLLWVKDKKGEDLENIYIATHTEDALYRNILTYNFKDIRFLHITNIGI